MNDPQHPRKIYIVADVLKMNVMFQNDFLPK